MPDVSEIRNELDVSSLEKYLTNLPQDIIKGVSIPQFQSPFQVSQFRYGQSNPTYLVVDASGAHYVLRRKPSANSKLALKTAHAIEREFYILLGISKSNENGDSEKAVPVPKVHLLCEDESVVGAVFYMMEYVDGRLIKRPDLYGVEAKEHEALWKDVMRTISAIHSVDVHELVKHLPAKHFPQFQPDRLAKIKNGPSYFQRQIKTLSAVAATQAKVVKPIPDMEAICKWTLQHAPQDPDELTLVHGDCKIDNFLFHPTEPRVVAVLDWELCTFGHPMFDLANFFQPYILPVQFNTIMFQPDPVTIGKEDPQLSSTVKDLLYLYQKTLGHQWRDNDPRNNPIDLWVVGSVFGLLRLAVISQGIAMRVSKGTASSGSAALFAELYFPLSELAVEMISPGEKL